MPLKEVELLPGAFSINLLVNGAADLSHDSALWYQVSFWHQRFWWVSIYRFCCADCRMVNEFRVFKQLEKYSDHRRIELCAGAVPEFGQG